MLYELLKKRYFVYTIILVLGILSYSNTFTVPFQFDDDAYVVNNPLIRSFHYFIAPQDVIELDRLSPVNFPSVLRYAFMTRILGYLSLAINYHMNGLQVFGYHLVNLLLHLLNGILIYLVLENLTLRVSGCGSGDKDKTGLTLFMPPIVALLFVCHPVQTHAVTYITSRFVLLASFFFLSSLLLYLRSVGAATSRSRYMLYGLALFSAVAAMLTKEFTFTLPVIIVLCDLAFFDPPLRQRVKRLAPISLTMVIIPLLVFSQQGSLGALEGTMRTITAADVSRISRLDYLLTQIRVVAMYLRLLILPVNQNLDHDFPVYHSLFDAPVLFSFILLLLLALLALLAYRYSARRRDLPELRLAAVGIAWFFITMSVESSVLPLGELVAEYRLYLPSIGAFLSIASCTHLALRKLLKERSEPQKVFSGIFLAVILGFAMAAYARNGVWKDEITLWQDAARKSPLKLRPHQNLGTYYQMRDRLEEAKSELLIARRLAPGNFEIANNLGIVYRKLGNYDLAIKEYRAAIDLKPDDAMARYNLGNLFLSLDRYGDALKEYEACMAIIPEYDELHNNLGIVYRKMGRKADAIREFETASRLNPENLNARKNLEVTLSQP